MHNQVESHVASLVKEAEETMSRAVGAMTQRLEHELETVASGTVAMSVQNTRATIDHMHIELQSKFTKDHAEL